MVFTKFGKISVVISSFFNTALFLISLIIPVMQTFDIFTFHFHALEKEIATHSSVLAWRVPGTGEPGGQRSMGSHRVGHD